MRDSARFDAFYAATSQRLVRDIYLATGDLGRAQDCAAEAYVKAWQRWESLDGDRDPVAWVHTVAWRFAVSDWRRTVRQLRLLVRHGPPPDVPPPSDDVVAVRDALARLPEAQRVAIVLHHLEDRSVAEIAELTGVPAGTVKARLSRGRAALSLLLDDSEESLP